MNKVSIIIPVYNVEELLKRCLNSIVNQTLKDIEIIIVNDGSTDTSPEIIESYKKKDERIKYLSIKNSGLSVARNVGIENATGEYISFVDSDDWVDLDFFEKLYDNAQKYDADIAVAGIIRLHKYHKKYHLKFNEIKVVSDINNKFEICDIPDKSYVWNKIYKTETLKKSNIKFEENKIYEDVLFTPQIVYEANKLVVVPDTYYYYWRRNNSLVKVKNQKAAEDYIYMRSKADKFIKEHNIEVFRPITHKYKLFGLSIFKTITFKYHKEYALFNIIRWKKSY